MQKGGYRHHTVKVEAMQLRQRHLYNGSLLVVFRMDFDAVFHSNLGKASSKLAASRLKPVYHVKISSGRSTA